MFSLPLQSKLIQNALNKSGIGVTEEEGVVLSAIFQTHRLDTLNKETFVLRTAGSIGTRLKYRVLPNESLPDLMMYLSDLIIAENRYINKLTSIYLSCWQVISHEKQQLYCRYGLPKKIHEYALVASTNFLQIYKHSLSFKYKKSIQNILFTLPLIINHEDFIFDEQVKVIQLIKSTITTINTFIESKSAIEPFIPFEPYFFKCTILCYVNQDVRYQAVNHIIATVKKSAGQKKDLSSVKKNKKSFNKIPIQAKITTIRKYFYHYLKSNDDRLRIKIIHTLLVIIENNDPKKNKRLKTVRLKVAAIKVLGRWIKKNIAKERFVRDDKKFVLLHLITFQKDQKNNNLFIRTEINSLFASLKTAQNLAYLYLLKFQR